jgi:broad specificity phosphatase PhoE
MAFVARRRFLAAAAVLALPSFGLAAEEDKLLARLRAGGYVLLMRHASTPSDAGDPPGYRLDDCATQRNLSAAGREEARRVGERLKREHIPIVRVYTSPWCRCRDTATLAFGHCEDWQPLASVFEMQDRDAEYTERVRKRIGNYSSRSLGGNVAMVTHNVNIAALTKLSVAPAEIVVVRPDGCCGLRVAGRLLLT